VKVALHSPINILEWVSILHIQSVSRLVDIIAGGDFPGLCDQKMFIKTCVRFWTVTEL